MYACICNAIRESDLRHVARQNCGDAESLYARLGKQPNCGHCLDEANELIAQERAAMRAAMATA